MPFERKAMRCINCGALIEIPSPEIQPEEIREKYIALMGKIRFPCPECESYQPLVGEAIMILEKF